MNHIEDINENENTEVVRTFLANLPNYEQLCSEIAYILKKNLKKNNIEFSIVRERAKTLNSFLGKIARKDYQNPFQEITDFAGVRVVYLYQSDLASIEKIINKEFVTVERVDKLNEKGSDKFGYGAIHFIVKLGGTYSGARYDDLKTLLCEIQVRTVLQDTWAIIDHHLVYKRESDIPTNLRRKLNGLSALFETADNQFDSIKRQREDYLKQLEVSRKTDEFLNNEMNLDSFISYLNWKFPKYRTSYFVKQPEIIFKNIARLKFSSLRELDNIVAKYMDDVPVIKAKFEEQFKEQYLKDKEMPSSLMVVTILEIDKPEPLSDLRLPEEVKAYIKNNFFKR